ncbi:unnamed protein product [Mytilus coruscus]|uniref:Rhodanese domain-containing protein n=1 Tax=Mytilus coruscus TaxID=42192 RepID=A0A6J8DYH9_MYTCO|nr:unnamed protein product [Mytilus coruscus]
MHSNFAWLRISPIGVNCARRFVNKLPRPINIESRHNIGYRNHQNIITPTRCTLFSVKNFSRRTPDTANVEYDQLVSGLKDGCMLLIDVRDAYELDKFGRFHQNAINVPLDQLAEAFNMSPEHFKVLYGYDLPELEDNIVFVCRSSERSSSAVEMTIEYGYENAKHFPGGLSEWMKRKASLESSEDVLLCFPLLK